MDHEACDDFRRLLKSMGFNFELTDEEITKSVQTVQKESNRLSEIGRKKWPDGVICSECEINCQSFYLSDDNKSCEYYGLPFKPSL